MQKFYFEKVYLKDVYVINPFCVEDERGLFIKYFEKETYMKNGINLDTFNESFESVSKKGVIRGLHFQEGIQQSKLVRVPYGEILDVVVDIRKDSETFGKYFKIKLSDYNRKVLFVPKGFAHGFITLSDSAIVSYMCDEKFDPKTDSGIVWNDKVLNIDWEIDNNNNNVIISDKDRALQTFNEYCKKI